MFERMRVINLRDFLWLIGMRLGKMFRCVRIHPCGWESVDLSQKGDWNDFDEGEHLQEEVWEEGTGNETLCNDITVRKIPGEHPDSTNSNLWYNSNEQRKNEDYWKKRNKKQEQRK